MSTKIANFFVSLQIVVTSSGFLHAWVYLYCLVYSDCGVSVFKSSREEEKELRTKFWIYPVTRERLLISKFRLFGDLILHPGTFFSSHCRFIIDLLNFSICEVQSNVGKSQ